MIRTFNLGAAAVAVASFALLAAPTAEARGGGYGGEMRVAQSRVSQRYVHYDRHNHHDRNLRREYPGGAVRPVKGTPSDPNIGHRGASTTGTKYPGGAVKPVKG